MTAWVHAKPGDRCVWHRKVRGNGTRTVKIPCVIVGFRGALVLIEYEDPDGDFPADPRYSRVRAENLSHVEEGK